MDWANSILKDETEPIESTFELNDTLYARANIPPTDEVYIWLGVRILHREKERKIRKLIQL